MVSEVASAGAAVALLPHRPAQASQPQPEGVSPTETRPGGAQSVAEQVRSVENSAAAQSNLETDQKILDEAVQQISDHVQNLRRELQFNVDEVTGRTVVKVIDSSTDEVIRQIPAEEVLQLAERLKSMDHGEEAQGLILQMQV